ncbi:MAG: hypothetical protein G01um101425_4 [Candidatus Peregrinibacteria bacterium Gr01-1014_25]|nr:MAG: hypothetical protein G01um101425_4 [Candidatus Peregrinibacteria bacterium Gr01-1014_25]
MAAKNLFVGFIPDGNRRAVQHDVSRYLDSYERGADVVGDMLKLCIRDERVKIFAVWGMSLDNATKRSPEEVVILQSVFAAYLTKLRSDLNTDPYRDVKVVHLGNARVLSPEVEGLLDDVTRFTRERTGKIFGLCLGYDAKDEWERATDQYAAAKTDGEASPVWEYLDLPRRGDMPFQPVDLIVATGRAQPYTSGFLLPYQIGSGTLEHFIPEHLPDCHPSCITRAIDEYEKRVAQQRKGK